MAVAAIVGDFGYGCAIVTAQQVKARAIKPDIPKVVDRCNADVRAERSLQCSRVHISSRGDLIQRDTFMRVSLNKLSGAPNMQRATARQRRFEQM